MGNPFTTSNSSTPASKVPQDRFSSGSNEFETAACSDDLPPKLPQRGDNALGMPPQRGYSPATIRHSIIFTNGVRGPPESPQSPPSQRAYRRSSLDHFTTAVGVLAKQPVKLAKQPVRLAKYTTKKVRKGVGRVRRSRDSSDDDMMDVGLDNTSHRQHFRRPKGFRPSTLSSDDEDFNVRIAAAETDFRDDSFRDNPLPPPRRRHGVEDDIVQEERYGNEFDRETNCVILPGSSPTGFNRRGGRRSSLSHVTNAIGVLAKQPVKLAKQPVRFAKYTTKKVRKRVVRARHTKSSDDDDDDSLDGINPAQDRPSLPAGLPLAPPVYFSDDDDTNFEHINSSATSVQNKPHQQLGMETSDEDEIDFPDGEEVQAAAPRDQSRRRRSSLQHVTSAIGTVAKQPYKLAKYTAKQPIKLAKYTGKNIRKRIKTKKQDDDSIVSDDHPDELVVSGDDDDGPLGLCDGINGSKEESSSRNKKLVSVRPQRMLSPVADVSEHDSSSAGLSPVLSSVSPPNFGAHTVDDDITTVNISEILIADDLDRRHSNEGEGRVDDEVAEESADENGSRRTFTLREIASSSNPSPHLSRRLSMTGDIVSSDEFSSDETLLNDLTADVDQEDMQYLEAKRSSLSCAQETLAPLSSVKSGFAPVVIFANPQDTHEYLEAVDDKNTEALDEFGMR